MKKNAYRKYEITDVTYSFDGIEEDLNNDFVFYLKKDKKESIIEDGLIHDRISDDTGWLILEYSINECDEEDVMVESEKLILYPSELD